MKTIKHVHLPKIMTGLTSMVLLAHLGYQAAHGEAGLLAGIEAVHLIGWAVQEVPAMIDWA